MFSRVLSGMIHVEGVHRVQGVADALGGMPPQVVGLRRNVPCALDVVPWPGAEPGLTTAG